MFNNDNPMLSIPKILYALVCGFLAIFAVRVTYPIVDIIFGMWETSILKVVGTLIYWFIIVFVLWVLTYAKIFETKQEAKK